MRREWISNVYQVVGLAYFSFGTESQKFRIQYPTDYLKGALINSKSERNLGKLVSPSYSRDQLRRILSKSGRKKVLNARVLEVKPNVKSRVYSGKVRPMNPKRLEPHKVSIINAHDMESVEFTCDCDKQTEYRNKRSIWDQRLLDEWNLVNPFHSFSTCPHICAVDSHIRNSTGSSALGLKDFDNPKLGGLEFPDSLKPYVLSYIDVTKKFPRLPDYVIDFAFIRKSSMFDSSKKQVDKLREKYGLKEYTLYSDKALEKDIIDKMRVKEGVIKEVFDLLSY
jgi:hypothetical protein